MPVVTGKVTPGGAFGVADFTSLDFTGSNLSSLATRSHADLTSIGTNTHAQVDTHLAASTPHSGHEQTANKNAANGYAPLDANSLVPLANIPATLTGKDADSVDGFSGATLGAVDITFVIDGGGSAITTGVKGFLEVPFACTIQRVTMLADQSGSIVVDIWKDTYANYPPTDADSITSATPPTISSATKSQDATLTNWTTAIAAGSIIGFNVDSCTTITRVTISIKAVKT